MKRKGKKIGLALGGGGARGLAHIGVLKALDQAAIPVDVLVGTSIGALVGGAYASGLNPSELEEKFLNFLNSKIFKRSAIRAIEAAQSKRETGFIRKLQCFIQNRYHMVQALFKPGILSSEEFRPVIDFFIPDILVEETRPPFRAVATDLVSGEPFVFSRGSLRQAITASCAVPGTIAPLKEGRMLLSDGGIISLVPCSVARREGSDIVIAVTVTHDIWTEASIKSVVDLYFRASDIMSDRLKKYEIMEADVVIHPHVGDLHWADFSLARDLIHEGERAAREKLQDIALARRPPGMRFLTEILRGNLKTALRI